MSVPLPSGLQGRYILKPQEAESEPHRFSRTRHKDCETILKKETTQDTSGKQKRRNHPESAPDSPARPPLVEEDAVVDERSGKTRSLHPGLSSYCLYTRNNKSEKPSVFLG